MLSLLPDIDVLIEHKHSVMNGDSSNHSDLLCCIRVHARLGLRETQWATANWQQHE